MYHSRESNALAPCPLSHIRPDCSLPEGPGSRRIDDRVTAMPYSEGRMTMAVGTPCTRKPCKLNYLFKKCRFRLGSFCLDHLESLLGRIRVTHPLQATKQVAEGSSQGLIAGQSKKDRDPIWQSQLPWSRLILSSCTSDPIHMDAIYCCNPRRRWMLVDTDL